jgi:hypothetical protein
MNILKRLKRTSNIDEDTIKTHIDYKDSFRQDEDSTNIVNVSIKNVDLDEVSKQFSSIDIEDNEQRMYIFKHESIELYVATISLSIVLSMIFGVILFIGLNTILLTNMFNNIADIMIFASAITIILNISLIIIELNQILYMTRYNKYFNFIKCHRIEAIDNIAEITGYKKPVVIKDLYKAIKRKYIPEGHFGRNNLLFIISDEDYNEYQKKPAVYEYYFMKKIKKQY